MNDQLLIATALDDTVRIYVSRATQMVEEARRIHDTWPTATAALGRTLIATLMMGTMNDAVYRLTVRIAGDGPLGGILAVSNAPGTVKGYVSNPHIDLDLNPAHKLDVARAVGSGQFIVSKDIGLKEPYQGVVPLQTGEIGDDFAYYFTKSEQTPSAVALGVLIAPGGEVMAAGGLIVQLMPGAADATITFLEEAFASLPPISNLLASGITLEGMARQVIGADREIKILKTMPIQYTCDCSKERFRGPLLSLGADELDGLYQKEKMIEVRCHFCNKLYRYRKEELNAGEGQDA